MVLGFLQCLDVVLSSVLMCVLFYSNILARLYPFLSLSMFSTNPHPFRLDSVSFNSITSISHVFLSCLSRNRIQFSRIIHLHLFPVFSSNIHLFQHSQVHTCSLVCALQMHSFTIHLHFFLVFSSNIRSVLHSQIHFLSFALYK